MGTCISFMNMKGGVGKSTMCVHIAGELSTTHGKRVMLIDLDPQFNATASLLTSAQYVKEVENCFTTLDIFEAPKMKSMHNTTEETPNKKILNVRSNAGGKLDLIPAQLELMMLQQADWGTEQRLKNYVDRIRDDYDYILLDCPPTISIYKNASVVASDRYIIPTKPDPLSVIGIPQLRSYINNQKDTYNSNIVEIGVVLTMVRRTTLMSQTEADMRRDIGQYIFTNKVAQRTALPSCTLKQKLSCELPAGAKARREISNVCSEFLERINDGN